MLLGLEKAFNRIARTIRWGLQQERVLERLARLEIALYEGSGSNMNAAGRTSDAF